MAIEPQQKMKTKFMFNVGTALLALSTLSPQLSTAFAQGTAFTYHGWLTEGASPATGFYDLQLTIHDSTNDPGGIVAGPFVKSPVAVTNGLFTVTIDFGSGVFDGSARWLDIAVRPAGSSALFIHLQPRQPITATPYAITAGQAKELSGPVSASKLTGNISPNNIAAGSITSVMLAPGAVGSNHLADGSVTTVALADGAVTAAKLATAVNWCLLTITNPTPAFNENFGYAMAPVGSDRLVIGAYGDGTGAMDAGAAHLFSTNGALLTTFANPTPAESDNFGYAVTALGNDRVLIGAPGDSTSAANAGSAYLFSLDGTLLTSFLNPSPAEYDFFGWSVAALGSDRVFISAPGDNTGASDAGVAYLFHLFDGTAHVLQATFNNPTPQSGDSFGYCLAPLGHDRVSIGAPGDNTGATAAGAAYLFRNDGTLLATFLNPTPEAGDQFGSSLAAVGTDRVLIGTAQGQAAYLFDTNGALLLTMTNPVPALFDGFGQTVAALENDRVLIGASGADAGATGSGAAYLFGLDGALLATFGDPTPGDSDAFGWSLTVMANGVVISARSDEAAPPYAGVAYLFSMERFVPGLLADGVRSGGVTSRMLADGAVTSAKVKPGSIVTSSLQNGAVTAEKLDPQIGLWRLGGNSIGGGQFLGTVNAEPLEFKVNGQRALRLEPTAGAPDMTVNGSIGSADWHPLQLKVNGMPAMRFECSRGGHYAPNIVGGYSGNFVEGSEDGSSAGFVTGGAIIAGGGLPGFPNSMESSCHNSAIGGGAANRIQHAHYSTIAGGFGNTIGGYAAFSMIAGGLSNSIGFDAEYAFAAGHRAKANHQGSFVWADSQDFDFVSTADNQFSIRAMGGIRLEGGPATLNGRTLMTTESTVNFWQLGGNHVAPGQFLGTVNAEPLEFKVNGQRALRLEPTGATPNVIGGAADNYIVPGVWGATIGGGGTFLDPNKVESPLGTIAGGGGNTVSAGAGSGTIGGGSGNTSSEISATVAGGSQNTSSGRFATVGGGALNSCSGIGATIGGGLDNTNSGLYATVAGGYGNTNSGSYATVPGGNGNAAIGNYSFAAGNRAKANHHGSFVWADSTDADFASTAHNQFLIRASGGVGMGVTAPQQQLSVGAGLNLDQDNANAGTVANALTFGSGSGEGIASKRTPGGNRWGLDFYTASQSRMSIANNGNVTVNGGLYTSRDITWNNGGGSLSDNQGGSIELGQLLAVGQTPFIDFHYGANRGEDYNVRLINDANRQLAIYRITDDINTGVEMARFYAGGLIVNGALVPTSDRNVKAGFHPVDAKEVLEKVAALPITRWHYTNDPATPHLGPMAQDFHAAFGVGPDDKHITTVDADGVALAAIQGLNQKLEEKLRQKDAEMTEMKLRMDKLERLLNDRLNGGGQ